MKATLIERSVGGPAVPCRAGFPIPRGQVRRGRAVLLVDGRERVDAQVEELATWEDGSVAHAVFSWREALQAGSRLALDVVDGPRPPLVGAWHPLVKRLLPLFDVEVALTDDQGRTWSLRAGAAEGAQALLALMRQGGGAESRGLEVVVAPRLLADEHATLRFRFRIRVPTDTAGFAWEVLVENCRAAQLADLAYTEVHVRVGGDARQAPAGVLQAGTRLLFEGWTGEGAPSHDVALDGANLEELMVAPPIAWHAPSCSDQQATSYFAQLAREKDGGGLPARGPAPLDYALVPVVGSAFPLYLNGGATGDRADIGMLPTWSIAYLNGGAPAACALQRMADTHGSCAFPIHWVDPSSEDDYVGVRHNHGVWKGTAVPDVGGKSAAKPDVAHHALVGALTYLATGSATALEELRAWALLAVRLNYPNDGTLQQPGDRREAWALRTIAIAARFSPDADPLRAYLASCLTRTASEWAAALPRIVRDCPLGNLHIGDPSPSGRDASPCSYIASFWQQAWFLVEALAADELLGAPLFRPLVEHGWTWWRGFLDAGATWDAPAGGQAKFTLPLLVDYSTPVRVFEPEVYTDPKTGKPAVREAAGTARPLANRGELAWQARIYADHKAPVILPSDLPADARPEYWRPDPEPWTPVAGSAWFEYAFGRCGLGPFAVRFGLPDAAAVLATSAPLVAADHVQSKRPAWAAVRGT